MFNPILGVVFHWLGGLASGSFYVPYKAVRRWSWETYWLVGGFFSWIICPWFFATLLTEDVLGVLQSQPGSVLGWTYLFGVLWGFGGLTFGLAMRYLGMSLGMGVALGYCAAFGTLLPPILKTFFPEIPVGENIAQIYATGPGKVTLLGVLVCLVGIAIAAWAGGTKEKEMPEKEKKKSIKEFNFRKGIVVATFSGIMSACFSFGLTAAEPIGKASIAAGTDDLWSGLPSLIVVMFGGFTTNFIWCVGLNIKNRSGYEY
ncbi:MAG: rhamnose/proton symporter RhaT, partial [Verrucomicrobiae bacterium]|nr:rhamnose/proton symporter RhaT [Verrucomicrobiae bacterium]NNJ86947.1 rhamnose/proton symporter RhaT [Akkermansiaceae bacterium]